MKNPSSDGRRLWLAMRFLSLLPLSVTTGLGAFLAGLITWLPLRYASAYRVVLINLLATHPQMSYAEACRIGRQSMKELGRTLTEFTHVWNRPVQETLGRISMIEGEQAFLEATASERPVLLLSLHQGSWEISNLYLGDKGNILVMYQPHPATLMDAVVKAARERTGSRLIPTNAQGVKAALGALQKGGTLAILADHNPGNRSNPFVPFFGYRVPTPALIDKFIQRYRPHVFVVSCFRGEGGVKDIRLRFEPAPEIEQAGDTEAVLTAMNAGLQRCIDRNLTQYQWTYKRFKWTHSGRRTWYRQSYPLLKRARRGESRESLGLLPGPEDSPS
ncbi:lipid A biosynthesis lauroyl acyltransferase [Alcanivorax hongdengensis A-11-3]|uniref:Lipid A biosynthesis lauroyl acyltransferase n=1 Tax=Alcanivorax hongdengensis A-11-3 TaxID=1177179 RepID=L0W8B8_9GAMM|nr:lysophospholipid acyltransferase family protein [Alcanivorax hongdengensis]EKF72948.1 lipid A biosynthesis lauroyl acyltransferase [Alcanivorax hongdengensis A-11-3]